MTLILLEAVSPGLRGELTRWLTALRPTVFIGRISPTVRELLWEMCIEKNRAGRLVMAWSAPTTERGFDFRFHGFDGVVTTDLEGVTFPIIRDAAWREACERFGLSISNFDP